MKRKWVYMALLLWSLALTNVGFPLHNFSVMKAKYIRLQCSKEASMAKMFASQTAREAAIEAVQVYGGYGYTEDYPVERLFRDSKVTEIYEGTNEIQRIVIGEQLLR